MCRGLTVNRFLSGGITLLKFLIMIQRSATLGLIDLALFFFIVLKGRVSEFHVANCLLKFDCGSSCEWLLSFSRTQSSVSVDLQSDVVFNVLYRSPCPIDNVRKTSM